MKHRIRKAALAVAAVVALALPAHADDVADFYRKLWAIGAAGTPVMLRMERDNDAFEVTVRTGDRANYHKFGADN